MIPVHSKSGHEMRMHFESLVNWYGRKQLIPVYIEDNIFNFLPEESSEIHRNQYCEQFSAAGKRLLQSSALVSPTKALNTDLVPVGDGTEPFEALRADVKMENR